MPIHPYLAGSVVFPDIIFAESQRWGIIALACTLILAMNALLLWWKARTAARPRPWRVFGIVSLAAALGALGDGIGEFWAHLYYTAHPAAITGPNTTAGVSLLYWLQTTGQCVATIAAILVAGSLIALYNAHNTAEERRHLATPSREESLPGGPELARSRRAPAAQ